MIPTNTQPLQWGNSSENSPAWESSSQNNQTLTTIPTGNSPGISWSGRAVQSWSGGSSPGSPYQVQSHGSQMIAQAKDGGLLDTRQDQEMLKRVQALVQTTIHQVVENRAKIDRSIEVFIVKSNEINEKFFRIATGFMDDISRDHNVTQARASNVQFAEELAKQTCNRFYESAKQLMELQKINNEGKLGEYKGVIDLVFYARIKEIELLDKRLELLQKQENHELQIMVALQNQELKAEAQRFDQWMQASKFLSSEDQRLFENGLKERQQRHEQEVDLLKLSLEDKKIDQEDRRENKKIDNEFEIDTLKEKNKAAIDKHRIEADKEIKLAEISSNERCAIIESVAKMATPGQCLIM